MGEEAIDSAPATPTDQKTNPLLPLQDYYRNEYTQAEQERGMHSRAMKFAYESSVHGGSQHGGSRFGSRKSSKANLAALDKGDAGKPDDSARGGRPDSAKV